MYTLGFPNREVEDGFMNFLLPYYAGIDRKGSMPSRSQRTPGKSTPSE